MGHLINSRNLFHCEEGVEKKLPASYALFFDGFDVLHGTRDAGLLWEYLNRTGTPTALVTQRNESLKDLGGQVIAGCPEDFASSLWWRERVPGDVVIAYTWLEKSYDEIVRAMQAAGKLVVLKLDSDGIVSPSVNFSRYLTRRWHTSRRAFGTRSAVLATVKTGIKMLGRPFYDQRIAQRVNQVAGVIIESPKAREHLLRFSSRPETVRWIPNPVKGPEISYEGNKKIPLIIAVGRWEDPSKNGRVMVAALSEVMQQWPRYQAVIVGTGFEHIRHWPSSIRYVGRQSHDQVLAWMREARIVFQPSLWESYGLAVAEGLCCGCTFVGTPLESFDFFSMGGTCGTVAHGFRHQPVVAALDAEIRQWEKGNRQAERIRMMWTTRTDPATIALEYKGFIEQLQEEYTRTEPGTNP